MNWLVKAYHQYKVFYMTVALLFVFYIIEPLLTAPGMTSKALNIEFSFLLLHSLPFEYIVEITLSHPLHSALKFQLNCLRSQMT